ncbi:transcriptional regulator with XRE-family HTH domain [Kibdelosporangium banguiense]|uniref:Transcriptional regulator with XRE-family HTH domain n=1 Tax=Kibdelosporangium banguiense TaxID=1365924 RepID=A0ABS4TYV3_9PSEU|nr:helix-turn-helix domain-containing protein [Kibdelosporangium banguiense]MBP2329139.1 transcriptional regulator with XRE-family HTH domain [Kibdelosporangium banguiense]
MIDLQSFGSLLRAYRLRAGMTQDELAETSGVSTRTISLLETGKRDRPRLASARLLAEAFGLATEERATFLGTTTSHTVGHRGHSHAPTAATCGSFLPRDVPDFVGRSVELRRLLRSVPAGRDESVRVTTVDGMAGVGKTAFAIHAAHALADRYPDGQVYVDMRGFTPGRDPVEPVSALESLLYMVGGPPWRIPPTLDERSAAWRAALAGRRVLVVLDNANDPDQVHPLLPGTPGSHVIVTSRRRMPSVDASVPVSLDVLEQGDAITLFVEVAGYHRVRGQLDVVADIVQLCGFLPLAVRTAAAKLLHRPGWTVEWLADQLREQDRRLSELSVNGTVGVAGAFSLSCRQLDAEQLRLFTLLGTYPGADFDAHSAAALADVLPRVAESLLEDLVDHHLLIQPVAGRYMFHDLLRDHARALATELRSPDEEAGTCAPAARTGVRATCSGDGSWSPSKSGHTAR